MFLSLKNIFEGSQKRTLDILRSCLPGLFDLLTVALCHWATTGTFRSSSSIRCFTFLYCLLLLVRYQNFYRQLNAPGWDAVTPMLQKKQNTNMLQQVSVPIIPLSYNCILSHTFGESFHITHRFPLENKFISLHYRIPKALILKNNLCPLT